MWNIYKRQRKHKKFKETGDLRNIYQNELDNTCFQHDMAYGDFDKILQKNNLILLKIQNIMDIKDVLLQCFIKFFDKKTSCTGIKDEDILNKKLAEELHKPLHSPSIKNIWDANLASMQLISKYHREIRLIDIYSKYA